MRDGGHFRFGLICGLLNMLVYGLTPVAIKYLMSGYNPLLFSGVASVIGALPLILIPNRSARGEMFGGDLFKRLLLIAAISGAANGLFFVGANLTSAMNTGLLEQIEPIYSLILSAIFLREVINGGKILASITMVVGAMLIAYRGYDGFNPGDLLIVAAPFLFQVSHLIAKRVLPLVKHVFIVPAARLFYGGLGLLVLGLVLDGGSSHQLFNPSFWWSALIFGLIFRTVDLMLWYTALKYIPLSTASSLLPLGACVAFSSSMFLLGETADLNHYLGFALILVGLAILFRNSRRGAAPSAPPIQPATV